MTTETVLPRPLSALTLDTQPFWTGGGTCTQLWNRAGERQVSALPRCAQRRGNFKDTPPKRNAASSDDC